MKLIKNYLSLHLKISLEYKSSFILTLISQVLSMGAELFAVIALFSKFKLLDIYNTYELLLGFSTIWFSYSLAKCLEEDLITFIKLL